MTRPTVSVQIGFGSTWQTESADITWTDVTAQVMDRRQPLSTVRGATSVHGIPDTGQVDLTLRNHDRRFDPLYTAGPYYGDLKPGVPIKVESQVSAPLYWDTDPLAWDTDPLYWVSSVLPMWWGSVKSWPQRYDRGNRWATVPLIGFDGFDKLARAKIPQSVYAVEVLADSPGAFWRLDEPSGTVMLDSSGNLRHGMYDNASIGEDPLIVDGGGKSMYVAHVGDNRGQFKGSGLPLAYPVTMEAWVKLDRDLAEAHTIVTSQRDNAYGSGLTLMVDTSAGGSPNGELVINFYGLGGFYKARGSTRIDDGEIHHVVMTMSGTAAADILLYVDGQIETKTTISGTTGGAWAGHLIWVVGNVAAAQTFDYGLEGYIDEVAVYPSALSAARVLAHYEAGTAALDGQTTDERVGYILDELGWPTLQRNLEVGQTILGPATFLPGDNALAYLRQLAATEDGDIFMRPNGTFRFRDRYWRYLDTQATTSQATFTDDGSDVSVAEFEIEPADDELLVNVARFTRRGGTEQVVTDTASVALYGEAELQQSDLLNPTDNDVLSLAEWTVATRSTPVPRVPSAIVKLHKLGELEQARILALDLGHRVTCERTPQGVGTGFSVDCSVAGIRHEVTATEWFVEFYLSPVPDATTNVFRWGTSEWDGTDVWAH